MENDFLYDEIIGRAKNFRWNIENLKRQVAENESYAINFSILRTHVLQFSTMESRQELSKDELLTKVAHEIYFVYKASESDLRLFGARSPSSEDVFRAYFFSLLCVFLHDSKRIAGKTLRNFVRDHHPLGFINPDSPNYQSTLAYSEEESLRKVRNRLLSKCDVYYKSSQWSAISKDAEHEWIFYYALKDAKEAEQDTFKRFGNLYNDIDKLLNLPEDDEYKEGLKRAYKKFSSKLQKLTYENYIELIKVILSHITKDKTYYGLNLYRLERRLQPYKIIREVNGLFGCPSDSEDLFLWMTYIMRNISFPKLYQDFSSLHFDEAELFANEFPKFLQDIVVTGCLIIDELVEKGTFGKDWETFFCNTLNEMAEDVLYDPSQLDFTVQEGSQEKFEKLLAAPVFAELCGAAGKNFEHFTLYELPF